MFFSGSPPGEDEEVFPAHGVTRRRFTTFSIFPAIILKYMRFPRGRQLEDAHAQRLFKGSEIIRNKLEGARENTVHVGIDIDI